MSIPAALALVTAIGHTTLLVYDFNVNPDGMPCPEQSFYHDLLSTHVKA
jgi:hypothetical protein